MNYLLEDTRWRREARQGNLSTKQINRLKVTGIAKPWSEYKEGILEALNNNYKITSETLLFINNFYGSECLFEIKQLIREDKSMKTGYELVTEAIWKRKLVTNDPVFGDIYKGRVFKFHWSELNSKKIGFKQDQVIEISHTNGLPNDHTRRAFQELVKNYKNKYHKIFTKDIIKRLTLYKDDHHEIDHTDILNEMISKVATTIPWIMTVDNQSKEIEVKINLDTNDAGYRWYATLKNGRVINVNGILE